MSAAALFDLSGRTALVTGSTRGSVAITGRSAAAVDQRVEAFAADGLAAVAAPFDVTDERAVTEGVERLGAVDVLVNNAGLTERKPLEQWSLAEWERIFALNVTGAFLVSRAVVPAMIERRRGKIVNVCSVSSELARQTNAAYTATKGALRNLTKAMCADWARYGIQANGLAPGYIATDLTVPLQEDREFDAWLKARVPAGRWGVPDDLAGAAVFLAAPASDFVNGQVLYVDGGLTAVV